MPGGSTSATKSPLPADETAVLAHAALARDKAQAACVMVRLPRGWRRACARPRARSPRRSGRSRCSGRYCRRSPRRSRSRVGVGIGVEQRVRGEDHCRRAVAALHPVRLAEGVLHGDNSPGPGVEPSMVVMRVAVRLHREHQARAHRLAVEQNGAGAADAVLAADMRAVEAEMVAQAIEQRASAARPRARAGCR